MLKRGRALPRAGFVVLVVGMLALAPAVAGTAATGQSNAGDATEAVNGSELVAQSGGNGNSGSNGGSGGGAAETGDASGSDGGEGDAPGNSGSSPGSDDANGGNSANDGTSNASDDGEDEHGERPGNAKANGKDRDEHGKGPGNEKANDKAKDGKTPGNEKANGKEGHVEVSPHGTVVSRTIGNASGANGQAAPSVDFSVRNVTTGRPISLTFPNRSGGVADGVPDTADARAEQSMSVDRLDVTVTNDSDFTMNVTTVTEPLNTTPAFEGVNGTESLAHMRVSHSVSDADIENVSFTFRLSRERLDEMGTAPENVALYRYHDGEWTELPTEIRNATATGVVFEALSPGLSEFAAGAKRPKFELNGATVAVEKIEEGDTIDVYVTVSNLGSAGGRFHADLILDDIVVDGRDVTVAAGGERRIAFERALDRAGTYEVRVNGLVAGEVMVEPAEASRNREAYGDEESGTATTVTSASSTATASLAALDRAGIGTASVVGVALLVVLTVGMAYRFRTRRER
ncbi:PGF-pre-PGF domain-containing protein [Salinigranum sp. GCM10025319]|uniref:PGF-pre-PGF domain-containing protein n=1 Tax=Salinigranum sp. GCM10025319 TaxID=3252687 RepID=UPI0036069F6B